jgi:DNA-binding CsgD family transcriptional regulator
VCLWFDDDDEHGRSAVDDREDGDGQRRIGLNDDERAFLASAASLGVPRHTRPNRARISSDTRTDILASLAAGFHGFISKHQSDTDILAAITDILSGRIYVPSSLASSLAEVGNGARRATLPTLSTGADALKLTKRQREVLSLLARGRSNKEIARALEIAEATTKIHMAALLRALGVRNRTEAAFKAGNLINSTELACAEGSRNTDTLATFRPRLVAVSKRA